MAKVIIVLLRKPKKADPKEKRSDPFWEFGSFGCTGCHKKNLLNPKKIDELEGARLAFVQGGRLGMRLVFLTPPIKLINHGNYCEVKWEPHPMPFRYEGAPLIINNQEERGFDFLRPEFEDADRRTSVGRFTSRFRSRRTQLPGQIASRLIRQYESLRSKATKKDLAKKYWDALPYNPSIMDCKRKQTYREELAKAKGKGEEAKHVTC